MPSSINVVLVSFVLRMIKFLDERRVERQLEALTRFSSYQLEHYIKQRAAFGRNVASQKDDETRVFVHYAHERD